MRIRAHAMLALAVGAAIVGLAAPALFADAGDLDIALGHARALQNSARILRNGATAGADARALAREAERLRADLDMLVNAHEVWAAALPEERRTALQAPLTAIHDGCALMREKLTDLDRTLAATALDRARVQSAGQAIGHQARRCEGALRRLRRG